MTAKLENAKALYLEGIQQGRVREAIQAYTGDRYTQHSTGVRDGQEGFVEFFDQFLERNPIRDIQIVRAIEDGNLVFVHASQSLNHGESRWVTMDMFDTDDNDKIVEHWDVIAEVIGENASGHSQVDGPTEVTDLEKTDTNKAHVAEFIVDVLVNGHIENITEYVSAETYIQHSPDGRDGVENVIALLGELAAAGTPVTYKYVHKILGQGDFVVSYCLAQLGEEDMAVFDLFRLENGLIVEHWDAVEPLPRGDMLVNQGKF